MNKNFALLISTVILLGAAGACWAADNSKPYTVINRSTIPSSDPVEAPISVSVFEYNPKLYPNPNLEHAVSSYKQDNYTGAAQELLSFVEKNPDKVRKYNGSDEDIDFTMEIKLFTNDRAGKAGRATWFIANKDVITRNKNYIAQWQVVVSSANAGGQKRDNQLEIIDNHSAFGRSRVALRSFSTYEEAKNFYDYVSSYFISKYGYVFLKMKIDVEREDFE